MAVILLLAITGAVAAFLTVRGSKRRDESAGNLHQIGLAITIAPPTAAWTTSATRAARPC